MIRPATFGYNTQTAASNVFQQVSDNNPETIQRNAVEEFNRMTDLLEAHEMNIRVFDDIASPPKPDVLFPNNWVSFHDDGKVILYPMMAENRRAERRPDIIEKLQTDFEVRELIDLSGEEKNNRFLEGTGSVVFDYVNRIAYACRSPRTDEGLFQKLCQLLHYKPVLFDAVDPQGRAVYHTNVMLCIGTKFAIVCLDAIRSASDQDLILDSFAKTGHKVVAISFDQMNAFAGNMLEVRSRNDEPFVLLSANAFHSLLPGQIDAISRYAEVLPIPLETIETCGDGSVRCMVTGIYLPNVRV